MTVLPRAATSPELAYLRSDNQASRLYLTFFTPATVYTARLAAVPSSTDRVASITYDNGSGAAYADVLPDQTLLIGTTAGGFDLGMARIRNTTGLAATSGTMNIGETSEIAWQANCYLTVLDEFLLWPRHPTVTSTVTYMDYDVAYVNQHRYCDSIPVLGPDRVVWLTGATVNVTFDGSQSWTLNNTITAYLWTAPGASATSGLTTSTPTITYNAVGTYRVGLQITNSDGAVFTGYRRVFVVTEASGVVTTFQLASLQGSYSSGGWSFQVKMSENAALPTLRDRMQVILHAKDNFGTTQTSLGYVAGSENVIAIGWIDQESIQQQREDLPGVITFTVEGPHYWLNRMAMFPTGIKDRNSHPTKWTRFFGLTAKAIAWHLLHWRTTATRCIDVYPANNEWRGSRFDAPGSQTIWQQLTTILENSVIAKPCCDRYARLFMQIEQNLLSVTDRTAIPSVMTLTKNDWTNEVTFDRRIVNDAAYVDLSGVSWNGTSPTAFFSLSPGHVFRHYGNVEVRERLVLYDQPTTTTLCGAYWGWKNNPYPRLAFNLAMNNRLIDLAPYQYLTVNFAAGDTPRGFVDSALRVIPRAIRYNWLEQAFALTTDVEVEAETPIGLAVTGDTPADPPEGEEKPPQPIIPPDPVVTPPARDAKIAWMIHSNGSSTPKTCVIYEVLDDLDNPVYAKIEPPGALNIDYLTAGNYSATYDTLMLTGYATATPVGPGWAGGASGVILIVTGATTGSPTWNLVAYGFNGIAGDYDAQVDGNSTCRFHQSVMLATTGISSRVIPTLILISPTLNLVTGAYARNDEFENIPNGIPFYQQEYWRSGDDFVIYDGLGATIADGTHGYGLMADIATYDYAIGSSHGSSNALRLYFMRRRKSDARNEIVHVDILGSIVTGITTFHPTIDFVIDETPIAGINTSWSNTLDTSSYCNVIPFATYLGGYPLYYNIDGAWAKAAVASAWGHAHYLKRAGGNSLIWIGRETVANGSEPVRYTRDVTDMVANPWVSMTGNMWSGTDKIIVSGDLGIRDSWLSF